MRAMRPERIIGPWIPVVVMLSGALAASCESTATIPQPVAERAQPSPPSPSSSPAAATGEKLDRPTPKELEAPVGCELSCATKLAYEENDVIAQPGAKIGDFTRCPVSGVVFVVNDRSSRRQVDGRDVFVCCESCAQRFQLDPAYFMARAAQPKGG